MMCNVHFVRWSSDMGAYCISQVCANVGVCLVCVCVLYVHFAHVLRFCFFLWPTTSAGTQISLHGQHQWDYIWDIFFSLLLFCCRMQRSAKQTDMGQWLSSHGRRINTTCENRRYVYFCCCSLHSSSWPVADRILPALLWSHSAIKNGLQSGDG